MGDFEDTISRAEALEDNSTDLLTRAAAESLRLLRDNLAPTGILAASRTDAAEARSYTRIFGRDASICVLAMGGSGDELLEHGAIDSLDSLAKAQAPNGQIPKYVDPSTGEADFWYTGCIDATLWWLIAVDHMRETSEVEGVRHRWEPQVQRALQWLLAQEHPRFFLLQQNEASDWADIMPRSGFVLYTNALWYRVKLLFELPNLEQTRHHFNNIFNPFQSDLPAYRRERLLGHYARRGQSDPGLYLSFMNLSFSGTEGDVFGNLLAVLYGLADDEMSDRILQTLSAAQVADPFPVRVVTDPIQPGSKLWRGYMERHQQNYPHQYHNGGIWPFVGGFWAMALAQSKNPLHREAARGELRKLANVNRLDNWRFTEWFHGETLQPMGMAGQTWNAATYLMAREAIEAEGL